MSHKKHRQISIGIPVKIVLIFLLFLIPIYALLLVSAAAYMHSLDEQALANTQSVLNLTLTELDAETKRIDRYFFNLQENDVEYQHLPVWNGSSRDWIALYKTNNNLFQQNGLSSYSLSYFLYMKSEDLFLFVNQSLPYAERTILQENLKRTDSIQKNTRWSVLDIDHCPYLIHTIGYSDVYLGAMINLDSILNTIQNRLPYEHLTFKICPKNNREFFSKYFISKEILDSGQSLFVGLNQSEIRQRMPKISRIILIVGIVLIILLPIVLIYTFIRMIARPLRWVENGIQQFGMGNPDYRIPEFQASPEFVSLRDSFNTMAGEIQTLKIKSYEEQLERERMLLQNLLLQIRPHFLLNFFNQIFNMAELKEYEGIKKSSLYLSNFFRYLFRSERIATFKSELNLVEAYLDLMNERFLDCFFVDWEIDESLLNYRIPPLIVQNFVENIFKYAVSEGTMIQIKLSLQKENGYVIMMICDDGPGMDEEVLKQIRETKPVEKSDGTHIGIFNSSYRLKKLCGDDCILDIQSIFMEGTTVRIMLPVSKGDTQA